jgi:hypothetical protein
MLKSTVERALPGVEIEIVNSTDELNDVLDRAGLLLVNRVLDGSFEDESGIDLIRRLRSRGRSEEMMLISNLDVAQRDAVSAGARLGFGKSALYDPGTTGMLREVFHQSITE